MARPIDADRMKEELLWGNVFLSAKEVNALVDLIDNQPTLTPSNEWVSVEERLPEPEFARQQRGFYLVTLSNGVVKELAYEFRHVGWHETEYPVTHWMSLPAPPDRRTPGGEE